MAFLILDHKHQDRSEIKIISAQVIMGAGRFTPRSFHTHSGAVLTLFLWTFVVMIESGKPQRVEILPKMSSNSTSRADDIVRPMRPLCVTNPEMGALIQSGLMVVDGGSKNGGQLNALVSKRHAKDLTCPESSHKRGRRDTESESIKVFSDQEILFFFYYYYYYLFEHKYRSHINDNLIVCGPGWGLTG